MEFAALAGEFRHIFFQALGFLGNGPGEGAFVDNALEFDADALTVSDKPVRTGDADAEVHDGPAHLQFPLGLRHRHILGIELHHPLAVLMVVTHGRVAVAALFIVLDVDPFGPGFAKDVFDQLDELRKGRRAGQLVE